MSDIFIFNGENEKKLKERFEDLIPESPQLKFLVGFFYFSGWKEIYESLQENEDFCLKILVGLQVEKHFSSLVEVGENDEPRSNEEYFSMFIESMGNAINNADMDNEEFYNQVQYFKELINTDKLIIAKTKDPNHAKLYLFEYSDKNKKLLNKKGQFITGSSNLTKAGLSTQNEFNVEISDSGFEKAEEYFERLWKTAIPITELENGKKIIIDFLENKSQSSFITPFEAYALILKTYVEIQEVKHIEDHVVRLIEENGFEKYQYQIDAVNEALTKIEVNNGVIIADVVGLGKSVIASLIASQLGKRGLILSPPGLIGNKKKSTGWWEYIDKFKLYNWEIESSGSIPEVWEGMQRVDKGYEVIIIDEAHKFRNQDTEAYDALLNICRGKKVILLTATPFNNSPADVFSLLKLFLIPGQSIITLENDLEVTFSGYNNRFRILSNILKNYNSNNLDKKKRAEKAYIKLYDKSLPVDIQLVKKDVSRMASKIKETIQPVTIRRNRLDLKKDFEYKKEISNLSTVKDPEEQFFDLSPEQSDFYTQIISNYFGENGEFTGAIYKPFLYETPLKNKEKLNENENRALQQQSNLYDFMRRLLVKRFESSFGAFNESIKRFLKTHEMVLSFIEHSDKYIMDRKVIDSIYDDEDGADDFSYDAIKHALEEFERNAINKTKPKHSKIYDLNTFYKKDEFLNDIRKDIQLFKRIEKQINKLDLVVDDPKREDVLETVKQVLKVNNKPKRKIIIFTEYTDTVVHLSDYFEKELKGRVLICKGDISKNFREALESNFDAKSREQKDDYDVLITSDKLSEGYNLNRAGLIINYDIPWNPTRVIQRLGRINRMSAKVFDELYIYNFFPTEQGANIVKSREIAQQKMFLIHNALGEDSKIFDVDEEPKPSNLFNKANANPEDDEELNISTIIRNDYHRIIENHPEIIDKISQLPNRVKSGKSFKEENVVVLRKKGVALFSILQNFADLEKKNSCIEIPFQEHIQLVQCNYDEPRVSLNHKFWEAYENIKQYKPPKNNPSKEKSLETKAINSLKSILREDKLDQQLVSFINTLIKDLKHYKTLSTYALRHLDVEQNNNSNEKVLENIKDLRRKLGEDYLDRIKKNSSQIENDVIISVGNFSTK